MIKRFRRNVGKGIEKIEGKLDLLRKLEPSGIMNHLLNNSFQKTVVMSQFQSLNLQELLAAKSEIESLIELRKKEAKDELLRDFRERAERLGIDFNELIAPNKKKSTAKAAVKYRNPDKQAETWSGMGRQPKWVKQQLESGKTLEEMEI